MSASPPLRALLLATAALLLVACSDKVTPTEPALDVSARAAHAPGQLAAWFNGPASEALGLPQTVYAAQDERASQLVFGVEHRGVARAIDRVMAAHGVPENAYRVEVTEPIRFMNTLRSQFRPTIGGVQIHFSSWVCTLGFNVDHGGTASFITNSHCTDKQGSVTGTLYYQPASSVNSTSIGIEVADPTYGRGGGCSVGKVCRFSDAARANYHNGVQSSRGVIAKTTGVNNGSLDVSGNFTIASQNNTTTSYSGTMHKVGRTTGWTSGTVTNTCATVNVSGSNIQLRCQTLVQRTGSQIVGGGDSGSPVFRITSGDNVELVGILWGGSGSGDLFVFSPLKNVQDELGGFTATSGGGGGGGGGSDPGDPPPPCTPRGNSGNCR